MLRILIASLILSVLSNSVHAHEPFEITTTAQIRADKIILKLLITDTTAAKLCLPGAEKLHQQQLVSHYADIELCAAGLYQVRAGEQLLTPTSITLAIVQEQDLDITLVYPVASGTGFSFDAVHLARLADPAYGATFTATDEERFLGQKFLHLDDSRIDIALDSDAPPEQARFSEFLLLGVEHILGGYDHLLFLTALLVACRRLRTTFLIITAFTLAHSLTLAMAALGWINLPASLVEPLIAASIVWVGLENLWYTKQGKEPPKRWLLTLGFGLIHGLGFAGALREAGLPNEGYTLVLSLLGFNVGVELGQLAVAAIVLALLFGLRRFVWFSSLISVTSAVVAAMGAYWLASRLM